MPHPMNKDMMRGLLCCALEGGSNYWYHGLAPHTLPEGVSYADFQEGGQFADPDEYWHPLELIATTPKCKVSLKADDYGDESDPAWDTESECFVFGLKELRAGLEVMRKKYPHHWKDHCDENSDATTGDVFLQCALFGELVFG